MPQDPARRLSHEGPVVAGVDDWLHAECGGGAARGPKRAPRADGEEGSRGDQFGDGRACAGTGAASWSSRVPSRSHASRTRPREGLSAAHACLRRARRPAAAR